MAISRKVYRMDKHLRQRHLMLSALTVGFAGLFAVLTILVKYLSLLLDLTFKKQKYLVESIEKIQK